MESGYGGGVSEFQQFMVDGGACVTSLFPSLSAPSPSAPATDMPSAHPLKYHPLLHPQPAHHHQPPPPPPLHGQFHPLPFTHQQFQQQQQHHHHHHPHHHQFQLFYPHYHHQQQQQPPHEQSRARLGLVSHHHLGLDPEPGPENSSGGGRAMPPFLAAAMSFKLSADSSSGGGPADVILHAADDEEASDSRLRPQWPPREEESAIKEPIWRPLDIGYIDSSHKRSEEEPEQPHQPPPPATKYCKKTKEGADDAAGASNYKLFSELEAIYKPGSSASCSGTPHQTGSGSALTGDENPLAPAVAAAHVAADLGPVADTHQLVAASEASAGEEAPGNKADKGGGCSGRRKRKRLQRQLGTLAAFFERLTKQLMDHQESLHRRFLEAVERREQERAGREEAWRQQEAAKSAREATARAHERELATAREAAILAFLEKLTSECIQLPAQPEHVPAEDRDLFEAAAPTETDAGYANAAAATVLAGGVRYDGDNKGAGAGVTRRWPKAEVQALIRVRSGMERRFQEPGLKGPLWEEVSLGMAAMGYQRNAKRCKEKWENINKYFRKAKESGKQRPSHSKTCPYFHQLDLLYSRSPPLPIPLPLALPPPPTSDADPAEAGSELLEVVVDVSMDNMGSGSNAGGEGHGGGAGRAKS